MKKGMITLSSLMMMVSTSYAACFQINDVFQQDTNRYDTLPSLGQYSSSLFETSSPIYAVVGESKQIRAGSAFQYAWWQYSGSAGLSFLGGFSGNRSISYTPSSRGVSQIGLVVLTDVRYPSHPIDLYVPFCDSIPVFTQSMPKLTVIRSLPPTGELLTAEVSIQYDRQYSAYGRVGRTPSVIWKIQNVMNPAEVYEISTPHGILSFSLPFNGSFDVTATLSDGTYTSEVGLGNILYTGGSSGGGGVIQP